ncbi:hypothetical protein [Candidatus Solirubrobacter pratensis]|uniref:hypothetical protein n=1 Tax=Candidatus Solirubrobacter pratensis TaxID=1298857 RepID=UPI001E51AD8A|nr:hypothetical protein [Candidatus Solirubrobacter pratensis]
MKRIGGRRTVVGGLLAAGAVLGASAVVEGADGLRVTREPSVEGNLKVGQTVTAGGYGWDGPPGTSIGFQWLRCPDAADVYSCSLVGGATGQSYRLVQDDVSRRMRVALIVRRNKDFAYGISDASAPVAAAGAGPTPAPTPRWTPTPRPTATPRPTVTPAPTVAPVATPAPAPAFDVAPAPTPVPTSGQVLHQTATSKKAKMLKPFPTVRVRGRLTASGANVTLLTVSAPKGVRITATCAGSGCPARKLARSAKVTHLSTFERVMRSGTRLTIKIARPGYIAKVTVLRFRRGAAPTRSDGCLYPGHRKTQRCPAG